MSSDITGVKIWPTKTDSKLKANGQFTYANTFRIKFAIIETVNGLMIALPSESFKDKATGETKWSQKVECINKEVMESIKEAVMTEYQNVIGGKPSSTSKTSNSKAQDNLAF